MKKNIFYLSFIVIFFILISCNKRLVGKWDDNIKLSQKTAILNSNANSIVVTTESTGWSLDGITYNNTRIDLTNIKRTDQNFIVMHSDFQIERKNGNKIMITMNQNTTNSDRLLSIGLQNGDYFDGLEITQSK